MLARLKSKVLARGEDYCSLLLASLHHQRLVDVGDNTAAGNGRLDERVELFVTADRQLQVAGSDALNLEVLACVASQLKHLRSQVLEDRGRVHRRGRADAAVGAHSALEESVDSSHGELKEVRQPAREAALTWSPARADLDLGVLLDLPLPNLPPLPPLPFPA